MYYPFMYVLGANGKFENLFNILIFVILAVFWIGGFILKSLSQKSGKEKELEEEKKSTGLEEIEKLFSVSKTEPARLEARRIDIKEKIPEEPVKGRVVGKVKDNLEAMKGGGGSLSKGTRGGLGVFSKVFKKDLESPVIGLNEGGVYKEGMKKAKGVEDRESITELLDMEGPEDLRKAILHYEILGKPVSERFKLRDGRFF